jgi:EamA domain-containing membrane protein RarD
MDNFIFGLIIFSILSINDVISFGITKEVFLGINLSSLYWLIIPFLLYGSQILLFYYGLSKINSMAVLNIYWNLISSIIVTLIGIFYYKEQINGLKTIAILLAFLSISIFTIDGLNILK